MGLIHWPIRRTALRLSASQQPFAADEPDDEPDDWEPDEGDESGFSDWDEPDDDVDPEPEPGDFWFEPQLDND